MATFKNKKAAILAQKAKRQALKSKPPDPQPWMLETARAEKYNIPDRSLYHNQAELYRRVPALAAAADMIGKLGASQKYIVTKLEGEKEVAQIAHPFELLLNGIGKSFPNPLDSGIEFRRATLISKLLTGNAYWWMNKASESSPPDEIWLLPSSKITPVPDENLYLRGYVYEPGNGVEIPLETWEIVHYKRYNPFNPFVGLSALEALAVTALTDINAREWQLRFFDKTTNARLPGIISFLTMIGDTDWEKIKRDFADASDKRNQMLLRGVGEKGIKWDRAGDSHSDMEFLQGLTQGKEVMWDAVAPGLASMLAVNATEASSKTGENIFREYTVWPELVDMSDKIEHEILPLYGEGLRGEFEDIRVTDRLMKLKEQEQAEKIHTIDELREIYYDIKSIGDERGNLLIAEIEPVSISSDATLEDPPATTPPEVAPEEEPVKSEYYKELGRIRRWGRKRIGKPFTFKSDVVTNSELEVIAVKFAECKTPEDVDGIFDDMKEQIDGSAGIIAKLEEVANSVKAAPVQPNNIINLSVPAKARDVDIEEITELVVAGLQGVVIKPAMIKIADEAQPTPTEKELE